MALASSTATAMGKVLVQETAWRRPSLWEGNASGSVHGLDEVWGHDFGKGRMGCQAGK